MQVHDTGRASPAETDDGLALQYDSSASSSDTVEQAEVETKASGSTGVSDAVSAPADEQSQHVQIARHADLPLGSRDGPPAEVPTAGEAAALQADGPGASKVSDRIIRAREWASQRRKTADERLAKGPSEASARAQTSLAKAGAEGNAREMDCPVSILRTSTHGASERVGVAPASVDADLEMAAGTQRGRGHCKAEGQVTRQAGEDAVAADKDVLDLDAEDAAAAASRQIEAWQAEEVCFTIG